MKQLTILPCYKFKILIIFCFAVLTGCRSDNCLPFKPFGEIPAYVFEIPINISPLKDTLELGDTLFIQVLMDDSIYENTLEKYKLANFPFYITPLFERISDNFSQTTTFTQPAQKEIDVIMTKGWTQHPDTANDPTGRRGLIKYYFSYTSAQQYELTLALVPTIRGIYLLNFGDINIPKNSFPWVCSYRNIVARLNVNNEKSNFEILQQKTIGSMWHIEQEQKYGGIHHTISHDTLKNYRPPRLLSLYYCFVIK